MNLIVRILAALTVTVGTLGLAAQLQDAANALEIVTLGVLVLAGSAALLIARRVS